MRHIVFPLIMLFAVLLLSACARPWSHPDYSGEKQVKYHYNKDLTDCTAFAGDKFPQDNDAQKSEVDLCMEKKGWTRSEGPSLLRN